MADMPKKKKRVVDTRPHLPKFTQLGVATHVYRGARRQYLAAKEKYEAAVAVMKELGLPIEN
jgi:hypothetical protein